MTTSLHQELGFEVYPHDLQGIYVLDEAVKAVEDIGEGWRLPTQDELDRMYYKQKDIGGFEANYYWGCSEIGDNLAVYQNFGNGYQYRLNYKNNYFRVRPVRDLNPLKERIDKVVSETPSTWREEAEEYEANKKLYDRIVDVELRLECCKDASNGKDLLIPALEQRITELEKALATLMDEYLCQNGFDTHYYAAAAVLTSREKEEK